MFHVLCIDKSSFRCAENECSAAFTTKQCLQFHYKKVHGFAQEQMPKIERSVAYTFDAYSGGLKNEALGAKIFESGKGKSRVIEVLYVERGLKRKKAFILS